MNCGLAGMRGASWLPEGPAWPQGGPGHGRLGGFGESAGGRRVRFRRPPVVRGPGGGRPRRGRDDQEPGQVPGAGTPVRGDVEDSVTLGPAMTGCRAAYYLVHSLQDADFERKDAAGATAFGEAAARAGLRRIIYLGGLGDDADNLSAHLRSRREVENLLGAGGVPV